VRGETKQRLFWRGACLLRGTIKPCLFWFVWFAMLGPTPIPTHFVLSSFVHVLTSVSLCPFQNLKRVC